MALMRGITSAKKILRHSASGTSKAASTPKGFLAVYVGESEKTRYLVPLSFLNHPSFQTLLSKTEEEFGFDHPTGGLTIFCPEDIFISITSQLH